MVAGRLVGLQRCSRAGLQVVARNPASPARAASTLDSRGCIRSAGSKYQVRNDCRPEPGRGPSLARVAAVVGTGTGLGAWLSSHLVAALDEYSLYSPDLEDED